MGQILKEMLDSIRNIEMSKTTKRVLFWLGIVLFLGVLVAFFWKNMTGVAPSGDKPSDKSEVQEIKRERSGDNSQSNKPPMSSVKFFQQAKNADDNTIIVIVIMLVASGLIGYAIYSNKNNMV
jgi:predicted RND superfamily exporter protein